jgi:membrane-bound lytic murein transglycosylase F
MGFHYELLRQFSDHLGIDLEIITENHLENAFNLLNSGEADLLAIGLTVNSSRKKEILFTEPILETRQGSGSAKTAQLAFNDFGCH